MESYQRFTLIVIVVLAGLCSAAFGEPAKPFPESPAAAEANAANLPEMPFMAEITSGDVYIRSGPGTNYYDCGKLNAGDKIKVVGSKFSWLQIVAPAGCFAWISSQYVEVNPQNPTTGTVIGDAVRVYAGSENTQPMHSTSMLVKLNKGDKVTLLGGTREGYNKIAPPEGAYLWVSNQYVRPLGTLVSPPAAPPKEKAAPAVSTNETPTEVAVTETGVEDLRTKELDTIKAAVDAEKAKPVEQQNFGDIKTALNILAADKQTPRIASIAANLLKSIEKCELAKSISQSTKLQDEEFKQTTQKIEAARAAKLADFVDNGIFAVIGRFQESTVFAESPELKYYRVMDDEGKTVCYAQAIGSAAKQDLSEFIDKEVGLVGSIEPKPEIGGVGVLVKFTDIIEEP
ncbi:MAG: SH3 domain-containing protein [Sedimentisphaerales bacterium]|nr:SH3 domain-containing protein [Sedimentisphaerales bacterium]